MHTNPLVYPEIIKYSLTSSKPDLMRETESHFPRILPLSLEKTSAKRYDSTGRQSFTRYIGQLPIWKL
jgi:hypothetical protein